MHAERAVSYPARLLQQSHDAGLSLLDVLRLLSLICLERLQVSCENMTSENNDLGIPSCTSRTLPHKLQREDYTHRRFPLLFSAALCTFVFVHLVIQHLLATGLTSHNTMNILFFYSNGG